MENSNQENKDYQIWFPYEVFYIESMLTVARSAMTEQTVLQETLEKIKNLEQINKDDEEFIIDLVQNVINRAAALSKYFWPKENNKKNRNELHQKRGRRLREAFNVNDDNPLKDPKGRNFIEHFDEKLDLYLLDGIVGNIIPSYVGNRINNDQGIHHFFRAFYVNDWTFIILNMEYKLMPIVDEIIRIYLLLEKFNKEGGRLPRKQTSDK